MSADAFVDWSFDHYLRVAHPAYARELARRPNQVGRRHPEAAATLS